MRKEAEFHNKSEERTVQETSFNIATAFGELIFAL